MPKVVTHACPLDCPDTCTLSVEVEDGRLRKVNGTSQNPLTADFICGKVRRLDKHVYGKERLRTPMVRVGKKGAGEFRPVSWDEALDLVAKKFAEVRDRHGGEAILPFCYGGSNGYFTQNSVDARLFRRLGASQLDRTVCAAPSTAAREGLYGAMPGVPLADYEHAQMIIVWGCNPHASGIHLVPIVERARERGAKLVVVDPGTTKLAKQADVHLPVRPGTDVVVALSMIRWFFENGRADRTFLEKHARGADELEKRAAPWTFAKAAEVAGLDAKALEQVTEMYAESSPAVVRVGWGMERNRNGGSAIAAAMALPAVAGKFRVRGGGFTMSQSDGFPLSTEAAIAEPKTSTRLINMNVLGDTLLSAKPPVHAMFVYNANPIATIPDQNKVRKGMEREDLFTVVHEQVMTDSALYADVLLPATTFIEHHELRRGYGTGFLFDSQPAIDPVYESRPNYQVFGDILRRLGLEKPGDPNTVEELRARITGSHRDGEQVLSTLLRDGAVFPPSEKSPILFVDVFPGHGDKKVDLVPAALDAEHPTRLYDFLPNPADDARFPLTMISPALAQTISSTFAQLIPGLCPIALNPDDARARGIADGDRVRAWNDLGEVILPAQTDSGLRPGVVRIAKGLWARHTQNGSTSNALCPSTLTDLGGGACFNDARIQVELLAGR